MTEVSKGSLFVYGLSAGTVSAASTHFLDVGKIIRQVGGSCAGHKDLTFWTRGLPSGAVAQALRFATTIYVDAGLQAKLNEALMSKSAEGGAQAQRTFSQRCLSFGISMTASGLGEFLANPPVAIKNYQIANGRSASLAVTEMYDRRGVYSFFRGVSAGVLRKSVANAAVLQSIGPARNYLSTHLPGEGSTRAAAVGLLAGGLVGGLCEVATNPIDRVKTILQADPRAGLVPAIWESVRRPFKGAGYAFLRKGAIRAINWGVMGALVALHQQRYNEQQEQGVSVDWINETVSPASGTPFHQCPMTHAVMPVCV